MANILTQFDKLNRFMQSFYQKICLCFWK